VPVGYRDYWCPAEDELESVGSDSAHGSPIHVSGAYANAGPQISGTSGARVGIITSKEGVMAAVKTYIIAQKGDDSTASYHSMFNDYAGPKACLNKDDLMRFLNNANACVPSYLGGCGKTADGVISSMDKNGDGCVDWEEFRTGASLEPEGPPKPPPPPADPDVISDDDRNAAAVTDDWIASSASGCPAWPYTIGGPEVCRRMFETRRSEAQAKIARIEGSHPEDLMVSTMVPGALLYGDALATTDAAHRAVPGPAHRAASKAPSAFMGLALLLAIPVGIFLLAGRTVKRVETPALALKEGLRP